MRRMVDKKISIQDLDLDKEVDITDMDIVRKIQLFQHLTHSMAIAAGGEKEERIKQQSRQLVETLLDQSEKEA